MSQEESSNSVGRSEPEDRSELGVAQPQSEISDGKMLDMVTPFYFRE